LSSPERRDAYLFLSLLQAKVGTSVVRRLGKTPPQAVLREPLPELRERLGLTEKAAGILEELRRAFDPASFLEQLEGKEFRAVTLADEGYPARLREVPDPPPALFVGGEVPAGAAVAVVGSRKASVSGLRVARELGRALAERGVCVVSGLALGVDAAAHEGALEAGGPTLGVLGCGIDVVYPGRNRALYGRVRESGAIVSEYFLGEPPLAWRFPARNRVIAGLAEAVVVVEAAQKSGALITARHALDAGREVWAVPGPVGIPECRGSNRLISDGAAPLWDIPEFVESVAPSREERNGAAPEDLSYALPHNEAVVLSGVGFEPSGVDEISRRSGLGVREVLQALTILEIKGYVSRDGTGQFVRTNGARR
jgi:DNA processing protein